MPYKIEARGSKFVVVNTDTGDVKGSHESRAKAERQLRLLRGVAHGFEPTGQRASR